MSKPSIREVLESYGFDAIPDADRWVKVRCAFHGERNASASVHPKQNRFKCFACGMSGDSYDIIQAQEGIPFSEARQRYGTGDEEVRGGVHRQSGRGVHSKTRTGRRTFRSGIR
ncbi:CHC2 zinc finger domain-containing protein [Streptomyces sp. NPDC001407]|uniref:CHC2 zinc finger domain-containing protein n=1 Tax=Streptomyces sp. NPDC001407 TaxID=3364573 RepID=UPI003695A8E9